ncbi:trypsinogen-like protein 3 [Pholidichthys leucotaenia]
MDNGPQFVSEAFEEFEEFLSSRGVEHVKTAFYHLQANGGVERALVHATTGCSPAALMVGRELSLPVNHLGPPVVSPQKDMVALRSRVTGQQRRKKWRFDKKHRARDYDLRERDGVWVRHPVWTHKLQPVWTGPQQITRQRRPDTFKLDGELDDESRWHASRLRCSLPDRDLDNTRHLSESWDWATTPDVDSQAVPMVPGAYPLDDGKVCQPHSKPWHVYLHGGGVSCSGALIDKWWIVTSFECEPTPFSTTASLGEHDWTVEEGTEQHIPVADAIPHSPYRSPFHSLTMVRLTRPAQFTRYVQPIPLPSRCPRPGETCFVSGWGSTTSNQYDPDPRLKCITVPIVDDWTCLNTFPPDLYWGEMVCAGQENTDNCLNNRASVMVCDRQLQGLQWFNHGCQNSTHPTVYTKMCMYNSWIKHVMDHYVPNFTTAATIAT